MEHSKGFTLTELLITMAIVSILAAVAYPAYQDQARKTRRSDGKVALAQAAQTLERCYTEYNAYNNAGCAITNGTAFDSAEGYYAVTPTLAATTFSLSAAPKTSDPKCTSLTLNQAGVKGAAGSAPDSCW